MKLDERTQRLIAVGASITANCQPCLQINMSKAIECGADEQEIADAIDVGKRVRAGAGSKMDEFALSLNHPSLTPENTAGVGCGCS